MSDRVPTITIDPAKRCAECRKGGAVPSGLCLSCTTKALKGRPMKSETGRAVARRFRATVGRRSVEVT